MSVNNGNVLNLNLEYSPLNNELNDEEIIINNNEQKYEGYNNYQYINNNINNNANDFEEIEEEEKSDDTIVAFQEEKKTNLIESKDNIFSKDSTNENEDELNNKNNINKNNGNENKVPNEEGLYLNNNNNNNLLKKSIGVLSLKKNKKKKKKKKKNKTEKLEIFAQDKKLKHNASKKSKKEKNLKQNKNNEINIKKINEGFNILKPKNLSKSIKLIPEKMSGSVELSPSKIIYENGVSDDEEEKKIIKKKIKKKIYLKPIMTPFLQNIIEKNKYNERLIKIRQQFTEKKFICEQKFFYYVLKAGNGANLVKNSLKHRINWKEAQMDVTSLFNFKWQASAFYIDYKNLSIVESIPQIVNHFEHHSSISNKSNMFLNLFEYCESHNINIWKYVPFTVFISKTNENEKDFDKLYDNINRYIINFNDMKNNLDINENDEKYSDIFKTMKCSIFGRRKDVPKDTWMMGSRTPLQIADTHYDGKNFWVLKASNLNRGQCIRLIDSKEKFHEIIKDWSQGINLKGINKQKTDNNIQFNINNENNKQNKGDEIPMPDTYITQKIVIQKYIEKPLCYYGRKCDMRVWVLLTQEMKVFIYKEGHLKTCSEKFDINNNKDAFIHITNYSFQKHCLNFQKYELGNEVPFHDFQRFLDIEYKDKKANVKEYIMNQVKYIIELTMKSVKDKINPNKSKYCFEIFGYDFMMDVNLNVYLIEINTNPGLEISSPWIKVILPRMIDDALRLTIDEVFPTKYQFDKNAIKELNYEDYKNDLNKNEKEKNNIIDMKIDEGPRIIKRKRYTTICDQGSGTQDKNDEKYVQENIRRQEIRIHRKINDMDDILNNDKENINIIQNNNNDNNGNNLNGKKINIQISLNNNTNIEKEKEKKINKEEGEKEFEQKDYKSPFPVPGYEPWENLWEFICELKEEKSQINYVAGVRGLLEIQKKRKTTSTPNNNNAKNNLNNNIKNKKIKNISNNINIENSIKNSNIFNEKKENNNSVQKENKIKEEKNENKNIIKEIEKEEKKEKENEIITKDINKEEKEKNIRPLNNNNIYENNKVDELAKVNNENEKELIRGEENKNQKKEGKNEI